MPTEAISLGIGATTDDLQSPISGDAIEGGQELEIGPRFHRLNRFETGGAGRHDRGERFR